MSKSNKLLMKLIKASGGWESFLYDTLKEVCEEVSNHGFAGPGEDSIDTAKEIIEAYEDYCGEGASEHHISKVSKSISEEAEYQKIASARTDGKITPIGKPVQPELKVEPKLMHTRVGIDKEVGASNGQLPVPAGWRVANKQLIVISKSGMELGRGSDDGQILGRGVSGHISNKGDYRLVFKEATLGDAVINYEILPIPLVPEAPVRPVPMALKIPESMDSSEQDDSVEKVE